MIIIELMKTLFNKILIIVLFVTISGCVYVDVKTPLDKDVRDTNLGDKVGVSKARSILWLVAWGDAGTAKAAQNGNIKVISHLDAKYFSILFGLYSSRETIAYGE